MVNKIYKFVSFDGTELDEKKLTTLIDSSIWISNVDSLNDSEEFKKLIVKEDVDPLFDVHVWNELVQEFRKEYGVCSFSLCDYKSKNMWENYGKDGNGFLMEIIVIGDLVHPVKYQNRSILVNDILAAIKANLRVDYNGKIYSSDPDCRETVKYLKRLFYIKETKWKIEKEYRIVYPIDNSNGKNVRLSDIGLKLGRIIAGYRCDKSMLNRLSQISNDLDIPELYVANRIADKIEIKSM